MLTRAQLLARTSRALEGQAAMTDAAVQAQLAALPDWTLANGALERSYRFANYYETMAFVNALAYVVHREDHHPDLIVSYNRCTVRWNTHSVGGISENDFICAAKADALHAQQFGAG